MPVQGYPTETHYSPNFSRRELDCRCGCVTPQGIIHNLADLAEHLEALRAILAAPLTINSGYRCPEHNKRIDGAPMSQHCQGIAADVSSRQATPSQIKRAALKVPRFMAGGIGTYRNWIHVDIRSQQARWDG